MEDEAGMSNTVKIKNRKKKQPKKLNHKLLAIIFAVFVAIILAGSIWATFKWGVGFGTPPAGSEIADIYSTDLAAEASTEEIALTPEDLEKMGISVDGLENIEAGAEEAGVTATDEAAADEAGAKEAGADSADAQETESK